jgi:drug/metabolite transporter (DMT)-like permease
LNGTAPGAGAAPPGRFAPLAALAGAVLIWGGQFASARFDVTNPVPLPADAITALRFAVAGGLFLPLVWRFGWRDACGIGWWRAAALVALAGAPYALVLMGALHLTPAAHAATINPATVCLAAVLGPWLAGRAKASAAALAAGACVVAGLVLLTGFGGAAGGLARVGDAIVFASGLMWAAYVALVRRWRLEAWRTTAVVAVGSLLYALPWLAVEAARGWPVLGPVPGARLAFSAAYMGVAVSVVATAGFTFAVTRLGPVLPSSATPVVPVVATLLAAALLGEVPTAAQLGGIALVVLGVVGVNVAGSRPAASRAGAPPTIRPR